MQPRWLSENGTVSYRANTGSLRGMRCALRAHLRTMVRFTTALLAILLALVIIQPAFADGGPDGGYQTDIPIEVPAYHGLEPGLRLIYSSDDANGWFGVGWKLSGLSYIERVAPQHGTPLWTSADGFTLDGQELLPCATGTQSPSCQNPVAGMTAYTSKLETFQRIAYDASQPGGRWYVWRRDGVKMSYEPHMIAYDTISWHLAQVQDPSGNVVTYTYWADGANAPYLDTIQYNGTMIRLYREERPDQVSSTTGGGISAMRYRVKTIGVMTGGVPVRAYKLSYDSARPRSVLLSSQQFGSNVSLDVDGTIQGDTALPPVSMIWAAGGPDGTWQARRATGATWSGAPASGTSGFDTPYHTNIILSSTNTSEQVLQGDFDGDARADHVRVTYDFSTGSLRFGTALAEANGGFSSAFQDSSFTPAGLPLNQIWPVDLNSDGKTDLLFTFFKTSLVDSLNYSSVIYLHAAISNGDGTFRLLNAPQQTDWLKSATNGQVADIYCQTGYLRGDAKADIVCSYQKNGVHYLGTAYLNGAFGFSVLSQQAPFSGPSTRTVRTGDLNADGRDDLILYDPTVGTNFPTQQQQFVVAISQGPGYGFQSPVTTTYTGTGELYMADVNGDGRADLVRANQVLVNGAYMITSFQTDLTGTDGSWSFKNDVQKLPTPLDPTASQILIGDANGDGRSDLFVVTPFQSTWACTGAVAQTLVTRVFAKADSTFDIPATWDDCARAQAVRVRWVYSDIDVGPKQRQAMIDAPDVDGDGIADFQAAVRAADGYEQIVSSRSTRTALTPTSWIPTDVNGDGRNDFINITSGANGVRVQTLISDTAGLKSTTGDLFPEITNPIAANWKIGDVNADGRADLVYIWNDTLGTTFRGLRVYTLLAKGDGTWTPVANNAWSDYGTISTRIEGRDTHNWSAADINGDGKTDFVRIHFKNVDDPVLQYDVLRSNGDGTWTTIAGTVNADTLDHSDLFSDSLLWQPADINGDGKTDFIHVGYNSAPGIRIRSIMNGGNGTFIFKTHNSWPGFGEPNTAAWKIADVNGDGKPDLVHVWFSGQTIRVHTLIPHGDGAWEGFQQDVSANVTSSSPLVDIAHWQLADVNHDGKVDLVHIEQFPTALNVTTYLALNTGQWRSSSNAFGVNANPGLANWWSLADNSGDGTPDLVRMDQQGSTLTLSTVTPNVARDLVVKVSNGLGQEMSITYTPSAAFQKADPATGCMLPMGTVLDTVSSISVYDARSRTTDTTSTSYGCAYWSNSTHSFVGWQDVKDTRAAAQTQPVSVRVRHYQARDLGVNEIRSDTTQDANGTVIAQATQTYIASDGSLPYRSLVQTRKQIQCNGNSTCVTQQTDFSYDSLGNVTSVYAYDGMSGSPARVTTSSYKPNGTAYIVGLPASVVVGQQSGGVTTELTHKLFCYDGDATATCSQAPTKGRLTASKTLNNQTNAYVTTSTQSYDQWGNVTVVTDANSNATAVDYDATYHVYPVKVCNALNQCSTQSWDTRIGKLLRASDPNGQTTTYAYDALARQTQVTQPSGQVTSTSYYLLGGTDVTPSNQRSVDQTTAPDGTKLEIARYQDGLGRTWKVTKSDTATTQRAQLTDFIGATSAIYRQSHWFRSDTPVDQVVWAITSYDTAGRVIKQNHPDATSASWSYGNDGQRVWTVQSDERGHQKIAYRDALGRIVDVREVNAGATSDTTYTYDMFDRVTSVTDSAGDVLTRTTWDSLGRKLREQDVDLGTWSYTYDNASNLLTQTDARGTITTFTYDKLNRVLTKNNGATTTWRYDEANHGSSVGRLTSVSDSTGAGCANGVSEQLSYDAMGSVTSRIKCITGKSYTLGFGYDTLNRMTSVTYPDGEVVRYSYDAGGRLKSVINAQGQSYVSAMTYTADDQIQSATFGNGTVSTYAYDPKRAWLTGATVTANGATLYQAAYNYLPNGLIGSSSSTTTKLNLSYSYDDLDRLTSVSGDIAQTFAYNTLGNMTSNSALGAYSYPATGPNGCGSGVTCAGIHTVKQAGTRSYTYDANGNMTATTDSAKSGTTRTISWNADNQPSQVLLKGKVALSAQYDASGERVLVQRSDTVRYVGQWLEDSTTAGVTKYYFAGGLLVARRDANGPVWFHGDQLSSTRLLTNASGQVVQRYDYKPFGETVGGSGTATTDIRYTGQRAEDGVGLIYMHARYYDPQLARFTAADTIIPGLYNPQSLNRYSYVLNNPILYNDPTGHLNESSINTAGTNAGGNQAGLGKTEGSADQSEECQPGAECIVVVGPADTKWAVSAFLDYVKQAMLEQLRPQPPAPPSASEVLMQRLQQQDSRYVPPSGNLLNSKGWTVSGSVYAGIGGGLTLTYAPGIGISGGYEIGVGEGFSFEGAEGGTIFVGSPQTDSQLSYFGEVQTGAGPLDVSVSTEWQENLQQPGTYGDAQVNGKVCAGSCISFGDSGVNTSVSGSQYVNLARSAAAPSGHGGGWEGKAGVKVVFPIWSSRD